MSSVNSFSFQSEDTEFNFLNKEGAVVSWLGAVAAEEGKAVEAIDYIFCSDEFLLEINKKYLDHNFYTDIITFPLNNDPIEANVFISIVRVTENAQLYKQSFEDELHRVIVHGLLHMIGYNDKNELDEKEMRKKEDYYLAKRNFS